MANIEEKKFYFQIEKDYSNEGKETLEPLIKKGDIIGTEMKNIRTFVNSGEGCDFIPLVSEKETQISSHLKDKLIPMQYIGKGKYKELISGRIITDDSASLYDVKYEDIEEEEKRKIEERLLERAQKNGFQTVEEYDEYRRKLTLEEKWALDGIIALENGGFDKKLTKDKELSKNINCYASYISNPLALYDQESLFFWDAEVKQLFEEKTLPYAEEIKEELGKLIEAGRKDLYEGFGIEMCRLLLSGVRVDLKSREVEHSKGDTIVIDETTLQQQNEMTESRKTR